MSCGGCNGNSDDTNDYYDNEEDHGSNNAGSCSCGGGDLSSTPSNNGKKCKSKCRVYLPCKPCKPKPPKPCPPADCGKEGDGAQNSVFCVPSSNYPNLDAALKAAGQSKYGYTIRLMPDTRGEYTSSYNVGSQVKRLRIVGDNRPFIAVGYYQGLGQSRDYPNVSAEYDFCKGGLGEWQLDVSCNKITVRGSTNPNFRGVQCDDTIVFTHRDGSTCEYRASHGQCNTIHLQDKINLATCTAETGEGFYIKPRVSVRFCNSGGTGAQNRMMVQDSLEISGVHLMPSTVVSIGTYNGFSDVNHSVLAEGSTYHVGNYSWFRPNVVHGNLFFQPGGSGHAFLQSVVGRNAAVELNTIGGSAHWFNIFLRTLRGFAAISGTTVSIYNTDFFGSPENALEILSSSVVHALGTRFRNNNKGIYVDFYSNISAQPTGQILQLTSPNAPSFSGNNINLVILNNSTGTNFNQIFFGPSNVAALVIDGTSYANITDYPSGFAEPGLLKFSRFFYT